MNRRLRQSKILLKGLIVLALLATTLASERAWAPTGSCSECKVSGDLFFITMTGPNWITQGETIDYQIQISPFSSLPVTITDSLPTSVTFVSATVRYNDGRNIPCTGTTSITCTVDSDPFYLEDINIQVKATGNEKVIQNTASGRSGLASGASTVTTNVTNVAVCGDGIVASVEACDDGNLVDGDGCSHSCTIEQGFVCIPYDSRSYCSDCGNGKVEWPEECDPGDGHFTDGPVTDPSQIATACRSTCRKPTCRDGVIDPALGEECENNSPCAPIGRVRRSCNNEECQCAIKTAPLPPHIRW